MKIWKFIVSAAIFVILAGCATNTEKRIDNLPMYGQPEIERPPFLKKADADFIAKASGGLGTREEASKIFHAQAERFMAKGNLDFAMRRYNQSWLLNPDNYQPYWGFARVLIQQGQLDDGIQYLEKAEKLVDDRYQKVALLTDLASAYSYKGQSTPNYFDKANKKFSESVALDPTYPNSWRGWAYSLYEQGHYVDAWKKVLKAESLNARPFPPAFITELTSKSPRPD
jgi:tetratricopeptide (TPR) repeat protein